MSIVQLMQYQQGNEETKHSTFQIKKMVGMFPGCVSITKVGHILQNMRQDIVSCNLCIKIF